MKKTVLLFVVILLIAAAGLCDADNLNSDWAYEVQADGTAMITAYNGPGGDVVLPEVLDGYTISKLGFDVFWFNDGITSVEIPGNLTMIGDYVFLMENQKWLNYYSDNGKPFMEMKLRRIKQQIIFNITIY